MNTCSGSETGGNKGKATVLLVDDEASTLNVGQRMLQRLDCHVRTACSGPEAVDTYREYGATIDLVMLDLNMPGMDGEETLGALRAINPGVRTVISSGYTPLEVAAHLTQPPPSEYLQKPYKLAMLRQTLKNVLGQ
ncbi:MAG: response regulator [Candidatus Hydrogenedentota bacterium]